MTSLLKQGINVSVLGKEPEARHLVTQQLIGWKEAVTLAQQCRKTHPQEPIELIPKGDLWHVVRCEVKKP